MIAMSGVLAVREPIMGAYAADALSNISATELPGLLVVTGAAAADLHDLDLDLDPSSFLSDGERFEAMAQAHWNWRPGCLEMSDQTSAFVTGRIVDDAPSFDRVHITVDRRRAAAT